MGEKPGGMTPGFEKDIDYHQRAIDRLKKQKGCNHKFKEEIGLPTSTTGPETILKVCKLCGLENEIGYFGSKGKVYYEDEEKKMHKVIKKALKVFSDEELETLMSIDSYDFYRIKSEVKWQ